VSSCFSPRVTKGNPIVSKEIRNLKHNIANRKMKLEKQYAPNLAIKLAATADCIFIDEPKYHYSGEEFEGSDFVLLLSRSIAKELGNQMKNLIVYDLQSNIK